MRQLWHRINARLAVRQARLCRCGHARQAHDHYRAGSDCGLCPCAGYRRAPRTP